MKKALLRMSAAPLSPFSSPIMPQCKSISTSRTALMYKCELSEVSPLMWPNLIIYVTHIYFFSPTLSSILSFR